MVVVCRQTSLQDPQNPVLKLEQDADVCTMLITQSDVFILFQGANCTPVPLALLLSSDEKQVFAKVRAATSLSI